MTTRANGGAGAGLTRRAALAAALLAAAGRPARAGGLRVAAIDWAMLETALALGVTPVAASELILFRKTAVEPETPPEVADLGLRGDINAETLLFARPDLILISPWYAKHRAVLSRVAPVASFTMYAPGLAPYAATEAATRALADRLGRRERGEAAVAAAAAALDAAKAAVARFRDRPFLIVNIGDPRRFRAFGPDSMFVDVLTRLGLTSAWTSSTRFSATATVGVEALAATPEAWVANVGPTPPDALAAMRASPFWRAMPPIAQGRFIEIAPVNPFGALPAAARFARLLAQALAGRAHG